jgi:hypothetical protein
VSTFEAFQASLVDSDCSVLRLLYACRSVGRSTHVHVSCVALADDGRSKCSPMMKVAHRLSSSEPVTSIH